MNRKAPNPFTLSFGKKPATYISRPMQTEMILDQFRMTTPTNQVFMITGVRGSGKTVMLANIVSTLSEEKEWVIIEMSPERDLLKGLAARLYNSGMQKYYIDAKIDLSFLGMGLTLKGANPVTDIDTAIEKMLAVLKKQGRKLLITIDEAVNSRYVREFSGMFQIYMRQDYPVYLLMTGLYENIYNLQNEKTLTFLYRAPKIVLAPLSAPAIVSTYKKMFSISNETAMEMAALTKGYPFAFQVLGYLCWESEDPLDLPEIMPLYDQYLDEYVYSKIWSELSELDKTIVREMAASHDVRVTDIREKSHMSTEQFSVYRRRLINKGIINGDRYGYIELMLPRFDVFVNMRMLG